MQDQQVEKNLYDLVSEDELHVFRLSKKRTLIGRGQTSDICLDDTAVSLIHAVIENNNGKLKIYDMSSENGTIVNGKSVVTSELNVGDLIVFGDTGFKIDLPSNLTPQGEFPDIISSEDVDIPLLPKRINKVTKKKVKKGSYDNLEYPLSKLKGAEFSKYIFEEDAEIKPIFHYDTYKSSVEVIVSNNNDVFSVQYVSLKDGLISLTGGEAKKGLIEFPYFGKTEKVPFLRMENGKVEVYFIQGFKPLLLGDRNIDLEGQSLISLMEDDVLCFTLNELKVFIRLTESPPKVSSAPFFRQDSALKKYIFWMTCLIALFLLLVGIFDVDQEELEKKNPQRVATILYKAPVLSQAVAKTKNKSKKKIQKAKATRKSSKKLRRTKKKTKKVVRAKQKKVAPRKKVAKQKNSAARKRTGQRKTRAKKVDAYRSSDFKSSVAALANNGLVNDVKLTDDFGDSTSLPTTEERQKDVKLNDLSGEIKDLNSAADADISSQGQLSDFSDSKVIATAGIPNRTVVLGGMDPDTIRKILMDHLPQFRFCYQKELDRAKSKFSGRIKLNFVIGASGHVTRAGVASSNIKGEVRSCVVNVLKGIPFPAPRGGGKVEVTQPMNFYPNEV